jgi:hypothetical protein
VFSKQLQRDLKLLRDAALTLDKRLSFDSMSREDLEAFLTHQRVEVVQGAKTLIDNAVGTDASIVFRTTEAMTQVALASVFYSALILELMRRGDGM